MDASLSKQVFLYGMGKLGQKESVEMFAVLVSTGQIWNCPTTMLATAGVLITAGHLGQSPVRMRGDA